MSFRLEEEKNDEMHAERQFVPHASNNFSPEIALRTSSKGNLWREQEGVSTESVRKHRDQTLLIASTSG